MFFFNEHSGSQDDTAELGIYRVMQTSAVLEGSAMTSLVSELKSIVKLPEQIWNLVYVQLIDHYIQFCQHTPISAEQNSELYLERGLKRAFATVRFYAPLIRKNKGFGHDEDRLIFAFFSAALLNGIGRLLQNYTLYQVGVNGAYQHTWFPNVGGIEGYYKRRVRTAQSDTYVEKMHLNYAQLILSKESMAWLMEDQNLYVMWVNALVDFSQGFDKLDTDVNFKTLKSKEALLDIDIEKDHLLPEEMLEAEKFWAWLKNSAKEAKDGAALGALGMSAIEGAFLCDLNTLLSEYAKHAKLPASVKGRIKNSIGKLGIGIVSQDEMIIEKDSGHFAVISTISAAQSQSHIGAPERFFSRVSGVAMQFIQAYTQGSR
ncbi:hypothetical protein OAT84_01775 [Gammaproteobacteria bacterium]|nr:hypothetical protein [Gammaproteobacteria bacterium]